MQNASPLEPSHSMPDHTAVTAAGAIGFGGYSDDSSYQYARYRNSSTWGQRLEDSTHLAQWLVGKYTAGVIAAYDNYGPLVEVMGSRPIIRGHWVIDWLRVVRSRSPRILTLLDSDRDALMI